MEAITHKFLFPGTLSVLIFSALLGLTSYGTFNVRVDTTTKVSYLAHLFQLGVAWFCFSPVLFRPNGGRELPPLEGILGAKPQVSLVKRLGLGVPHRLLRLVDPATKDSQTAITPWVLSTSTNRHSPSHRMDSRGDAFLVHRICGSAICACAFHSGWENKDKGVKNESPSRLATSETNGGQTLLTLVPTTNVQPPVKVMSRLTQQCFTYGRISYRTVLRLTKAVVGLSKTPRA